MANIINGSEISQSIKENCRRRVDGLRQQGYRRPNLSVILIGNHPASLIYVNSKKKVAETLGIECVIYHQDENVSQEKILCLVETLNNDDLVDGVFIQMPLPKHINEMLVIEKIKPSKDVDGLHPLNLGKLMSNQPGMIPCTPKGILALIHSTGVPLEGKRAVVLGRSILVGKPVAMLLDRENMTVSICHSKTRNVEEECRQADVLVVAIGRPLFVKKEWIKEGAIVIDVGINRLEDKRIVGDVDFDDVASHVSYISPVPKGVGPMTIAMLMQNTLLAYEYQLGITT